MIFTVFDLFDRPPHPTWTDATINDATVEIRFGDLPARIRRRAAGLCESGVRAGDRILISCPNSADWVVSALAVMRLNAIAAPIDPGAATREIQLYERIIEPTGVILGPAGDGSRFGSPVLTWNEPIADPTERAIGPLPSSDDRALILFTSGTTGVPKAAVQRHSTLAYAGEGVVHWLGLTTADRLLICMPLFHANAIYYSLMGGLFAGASICILPKFSVSRFWESVRWSGATEVNLMGPMLSMLLRQPPKSDDRDNPLRLVYTAASAPDVARAFMKRFGVEIVEGYGMTETPYGCVNPRGHPKWGSVGVPRQHPSRAFTNEVRIVSANGAAAKVGEVGEIVIRNDATFLEYWGDPAATRDAFRDGWLRTGDLGHRDESGYFYIEGRTKELIRRNGVNISPVEVEFVMRGISDIEDAALVGLPNPLGEELAILAVTLAEGVPSQGVEDRVMSRLRTLLSQEKMPDRVVIVDDIPKTHTQRIERGKLKECLRQSGIVDQVAERR